MMETLIKLFPFFTPDSHYATKPYLYGCLCSNYAFLCLIRASAEPFWVVGLVGGSSTDTGFLVSIGDSEHIYMLIFSGLCAISIQACLITRRLGYKVQAVTLIATIICAIQACIVVTLTARFANQYPFHLYRYATGGFLALFSATGATLFSLLFFLADVTYFSSISKENSLEQKKFEFANILFILYILFGAGWFCYLEGWGFERASEFCLMTLLTIGYGNIVPTSFWGRFFMICYTSIGLCVAGFFIISVEDVIVQDAESTILRNNDSYQAFPQDILPESSLTDPLDPDLINELPPIPLSHTMTNTSIMSRASIMSRDSEYPYASSNSTSLWVQCVNVARVVVWVLGWWLGAGAVFSYFEEWPYFNGVYFAFVSMTGIGYGDFTIHSPPAVEAWWIFLFNAISIIAFFISVAGRSIAQKVASKQMKIQRKRLVRQLKRKRIRIRNTGDQAVMPQSMTVMSASQYLSQSFSEQEMVEINQTSLGRRMGQLKGTQSLPRISSGNRLQWMFVQPGSVVSSTTTAPPVVKEATPPTLLPRRSSTHRLQNIFVLGAEEMGHRRKSPGGTTGSPRAQTSFVVPSESSSSGPSALGSPRNSKITGRDLEDAIEELDLDGHED